MWNEDTRTLLRRYRAGHAEIEGYAEDYAFLIFGLLELFQADPDPQWLSWAVTLQRRQDELFWDEADAGWFSTTGRDPSVLLRMKEDYDGAEPTASSVSVLNLLVLSHLIEDRRWTEQIDRTLGLFGQRLEQMGRAVPMMAAALSDVHGRTAADRDRRRGRRRLRARAQCGDSLSAVCPDARLDARPGRPRSRRSSRSSPRCARSTAQARAFVCRDFTCRAPVTTAADLERELR